MLYHSLCLMGLYGGTYRQDVLEHIYVEDTLHDHAAGVGTHGASWQAGQEDEGRLSREQRELDADGGRYHEPPRPLLPVDEERGADEGAEP
jgi:hypothetical protein